MDTEYKSVIEQFVTIRVLIGFLGEKNQFDWWDTAFLSKTGLRFLEVNFPRSIYPAGIHSLTEAAKQLHDSRIGKGRVFHLFRMPSGFEEKVFYQLKSMDFSYIEKVLEDKDVALKVLHDMTKDKISVTEGPIHIGILKNTYSQGMIDSLTQYYYNAFSSEKKVFPYFTAD